MTIIRNLKKHICGLFFVGAEGGIEVGKKADTESLYLARLGFILERKEEEGLAKRLVKIDYRVTCYMADIIGNLFNLIRKRCRNQYISSSRINRAIWMVITRDKELRERVMDAVCDYIKHDTGV